MITKNRIIGVLSALVIFLSIWLAIEIPENYETTKTTTTDSSTTVDTTQFKQKIKKLQAKIDSVEEVKPDTVTETTVAVKKDTIEIRDCEFLKSFRNYTTSVSDTLIEGTIRTTVQGRLISQNLSYKPLFPKIITVTNTIKETQTITKRPEPKPFFTLGGSVITDGEKTGFEISPGYTFSNRNSIEYGYSFPTGSHRIELRANLRNIFR